MAILYKSDIEKVNSYASAALSNEEAETTKIINNINDFIGGSAAKLTGKAWSKQRERFTSYLPALEKRKQISTNLLNTIKEANLIMLD